MRILVLCKRQYSRHDLLDDRFGRIRELPLALASKGHRVIGACLSYTNHPESVTTDWDEATGAKVEWHSFNAGMLRPTGFVRYVTRVQRLIREFAPDLIWACSDSIYGIAGLWLARRSRASCIIDLYDNFESFASTSIPGVLPLFRKAVRNADGVTCVSDPLRELVQRGYGRTGPVLTLTNAVRDDLFHPADKNHCRQKLGLPQRARIVGTAGALYRNRGIGSLYEAFVGLAEQDREIHLAVAGPRDVDPPRHPRVHDLGMLSQADVAALINSLDVAVICNLDSPFGRYCFPQKAVEILACRVPVVAARVGVLTGLLRDNPKALFAPGDAADLARAIHRALREPVILDIPVPTWDSLADSLEDHFQRVVTHGHARGR